MTNTQINVFGLLAIAAGCAFMYWVNNLPPPPGRYQLLSEGENLVRLDTVTGEVWLFNPSEDGVWLSLDAVAKELAGRHPSKKKGVAP